jgi:histidinol phosphatase-like PHP family hydrolase
MNSPTPPAQLTTNYHMHSRFCDGQGEIEDYVRQAIALGFTSIGASGHAPVPFQNTYAMRADQFAAYCAEVRRLQAAYAGQIEIALGAEVDVIPGLQPYFTKLLQPEGFDYCIGSGSAARPDARAPACSRKGSTIASARCISWATILTPARRGSWMLEWPSSSAD